MNKLIVNCTLEYNNISVCRALASWATRADERERVNIEIVL